MSAGASKPAAVGDVAQSIRDAQADLDEALARLDLVAALDANTVGFVAHALNNFLTVTHGTLSLLQPALKDHPNPDVHAGLTALSQTTDLMTHAVNQLMGRGAQFDAQLAQGKVHLTRLTARVCDYYQRIAARKNITITYTPAAEELYAQGDRVVVAAVLDNLLSNAVKFSPPGRRVRVDVEAKGDQVVCNIRDEGPGVPEADRERLFQRGVRLSAEPTGGEPSNGFGLAVAKDLIEKLGGEIWCERRPAGEGAHFAFRLLRLR
jgi:signal transduction histidine kinase